MYRKLRKFKKVYISEHFHKILNKFASTKDLDWSECNNVAFLRLLASIVRKNLLAQFYKIVRVFPVKIYIRENLKQK